MRWDALTAAPDQVSLARALVERVPQAGWGRRTLDAAATAAFGEAAGWRGVFPRGARDAIWFVSSVSDASMRAVFASEPAPSMSAVIIERLEQNADLKPFVRQVMLFDMMRPVQALARMDRTARTMFDCVAVGDHAPGRAALIALNLVYTAIVFFWLFDRSAGDRRTYALATGAMRRIGLG